MIIEQKEAIMDILLLGITPNSSRSNKVLRIINNNNRVSIAIKNQFERLNSFTKTFLATQYQQQQQQQQKEEHGLNIQSAPHESLQPMENERLQDAFKDLYFLLDIESFNFEKVSDIGLDKLAPIYAKLNGVKAQNQNDETTLKLVNEYLVLILSLNLSNSLIYKTLVLKNQQVYWETIHNSTVNKLIYFIQTCPVKLYKFVETIVVKANRIISSNFHLASEIEAGAVVENVSNWKKFKRFAIAIARSIVQTAETLFIEDNPAITLLSKSNTSRLSSFKWYITSIVKSPITITNKEIKSKIREIKSEIRINTQHIDQFIKADATNLLPTLVKVLDFGNSTESGTLPVSKNPILQATSAIERFNDKQYTSTSKPSFITRYWPIIILVLFYAPSQTRNIYNNREEIVYWIKYNGIEPIKGFFVNWVVGPINEMLNILRSDSGMTITSRDSLQSDVDSLEKMIWEFAQDNNIETTPTAVSSDVRNGDLKLVMSRYEQEIRQPIKYIISGSLLRLILIQVQKGKVDGAVAITGIDKLLKSQQLLFGLVSMSPSIIILYQVYRYLTSAKPIMVNGKQLNIVCLKSLNSIENLLIMLQNNQLKKSKVDKEAEEDVYEGELLIEIINLIISAEPIIPKQLHADWIHDLNELNNSSFDLETKLYLVNRAWNMYGSYFK